MSAGCSVAAERINAQHLERVPPARHSHLEFKNGTRHTDGRVVRQVCEQLFGKAFARAAYDHIGLADQSFGRQAKFVECCAVHQIHRRAQRYP